jgi:hypothetical protein
MRVLKAKIAWRIITPLIFRIALPLVRLILALLHTAAYLVCAAKIKFGIGRSLLCHFSPQYACLVIVLLRTLALVVKIAEII